VAQRQWNRVRRNKAKEIAAEGLAKEGVETKKFMAQLDSLGQELADATPAEREVIRRRILGGVAQN
jgi:hypothetical protein